MRVKDSISTDRYNRLSAKNAIFQGRLFRLRINIAPASSGNRRDCLHHSLLTAYVEYPNTSPDLNNGGWPPRYRVYFAKLVLIRVPSPILIKQRYPLKENADSVSLIKSASV